MADDGLETPIQGLIRQVRATTGWSYRRIANNSGRRADGRPAIAANSVQKLATQPLKRSPDLETMTALAQGLKVPINVVLAAVGQTLGYREMVPGQSGYSLAHALAERIDNLKDDAERGHILGTIERLVAAAEARDAQPPSDEMVEKLVRDHGEKAAQLMDLLGQMGEEDLESVLRARRKPRNGATTD